MTRDARLRLLHGSRWQDGWQVRHSGIDRGRSIGRSVLPAAAFQMRLDRLDREGAGYLAGIAASHAVTDDIESERRVRHKAILVMGPFTSGIGLGAMQRFDRQDASSSCRETLQTGTELSGKLSCAPIAVRQLFL